MGEALVFTAVGRRPTQGVWGLGPQSIEDIRHEKKTANQRSFFVPRAGARRLVVVELSPRCIQITSGKRDQMRPKN